MDTEEYIGKDIGMTPLKFKIGYNPEVSEAVQKTLFALGYSWYYHGKEVAETHRPYLLVDEEGHLWGYNYRDEPDFELEDYPLVDLFEGKCQNRQWGKGGPPCNYCGSSRYMIEGCPIEHNE